MHYWEEWQKRARNCRAEKVAPPDARNYQDVRLGPAAREVALLVVSPRGHVE